MTSSEVRPAPDETVAVPESGRRSWPEPTIYLLAWAIVALAACVLGIQVVGIPGLTIVVGVWLLAAALHLGVPGMAGPVCMAGGVVAEFALLGAASAGEQVASGHAHGTFGNFVVLLAPVAVGIVGLTVAVRRSPGPTVAVGRSPSPARRRARWELALLVHLAGFALADWVSTDRWHGVAWAMSGDARNHVILMRAVLGEGGLSVHVLKNYPALIDAVAAHLAGAGGRGRAPGALMVHDAAAIASMYVLSAIAIGCLIVAILADLLPETPTVPGMPIWYQVGMLAAATTAVTPLLLGTSLKDGYLSAYGALPLAIAACALAVHFPRRPNPVSLVLTAVVTALVFLSWTVLAVVPATLLLYLIGYSVVCTIKARVSRRVWVPSVFLAAGIAIALAEVWLTHLSTLRATFAESGAITSPGAQTPTLLLLLGAGALLVSSRRVIALQLAGPVLALLAGIRTVHWVQATVHSPVPTYYSAKTLYLLASSLSWLPFALVLLAVPQFRVRGTRGGLAGALSAAARSAGVLALSLAAILVLNSFTTVQNPLTLAHDGWRAPSAAVVRETAKFADHGTPFIFWNWSDPGDERLGDFWAFVSWDTAGDGKDLSIGTSKILPGGVIYWGYVEQGQPKDLCTISAAIPGLVIVTADKNLGSVLRKSCPKVQPRVIQEAYPG